MERMVPDLLIAMGAGPDAYRENNGYIISEQGKPPDFVLEIALRSTGRQDAGSSTGSVWPETGWRTAGMNRSPSRRSRKGSSGVQ